MTAIELPQLEPAELLAAEEVLLDAAEAGILAETLAFWESPRHFIVLGYGNKIATETNQAACKRLGIPILRRISGGGTVLQGPGVLNYSLVLHATDNPPLASITGANQFIMQRNAEALTQMLIRSSGRESAPSDSPAVHPPKDWSRLTSAATVQVQGHTDLAVAGRKFSGNAQRRKRTHLLFHGAILLNLDLDLLDAVLPMPTLQPDYREGRAHRDFLTQLQAPAESVKQALREAWSATLPMRLETVLCDWRRSISKLVAERYSQPEWNLRV